MSAPPRLISSAATASWPAGLSARIMNPVVPEAGQGEPTFQARLAIGRIPPLPRPGAGIDGWPCAPNDAGDIQTSRSRPRPYSRPCPCLRTGWNRRHPMGDHPCLRRQTVARHRLIGHLAAIHALEHLRRRDRLRAHRRQQQKKSARRHPALPPACVVSTMGGNRKPEHRRKHGAMGRYHPLAHVGRQPLAYVKIFFSQMAC
jgi:hypothetical protein